MPANRNCALIIRVRNYIDHRVHPAFGSLNPHLLVSRFIQPDECDAARNAGNARNTRKRLKQIRRCTWGRKGVLKVSEEGVRKEENPRMHLHSGGDIKNPGLCETARAHARLPARVCKYIRGE